MNFVDESGRFVSILNCPFGRRGSYFGFYSTRSERFGRAALYLGTSHGIGGGPTGKFKMFYVQPMYEGERVPFAIIMHPEELILRTLYGDIRICIAESKLILFKGENGLGIRFYSTEERFDRVTKPRGKNAWETLFRRAFSTVVHPIQGNISANAPWNWDELQCGKSSIDVTADENGNMLCSLEEFKHCGYVRDSYPSYEDALKEVKEDWETFLNNIPVLPEKYEPLRARAAYNLWNYTVGPCGNIKRNYLYMSKRGPASQWQNSYQAVAFGNNISLGWDQMLVSFDHQDEVTGQLPDFYDDYAGQFTAIRPPIQGWALKLMKRLGYYQQIPLEEIREFYPKCAAWADFFAKYRTDGVDGLPHYEHSDESGMEDGSTFRESNDMVTPDLPAYLVLLFEELGEMSEQLGMDPSVKEEWYRKAKDIQQRLIDKLWNGEYFESHTLEGKTVDKDYGILGYMPVILGHRLPEEILSRLISDLKIEGYILSDVGFDKEKIAARDLCDVAHNEVRGFIYHPFNVMLISALYDCGEEDFASEVASRYCGAMVKVDNLCQNISTFSGATPGGEWLSWTAGAYLLIAGFIKE